MVVQATCARWLTAAAIGVIVVGLAGCSSGSLPPQASPEQAREALIAALGTWQKGESIDALTGRDPPVYFNEPRSRSDVRLVSYKLDDSHEFYGQTVRIAVVLSFAFPDGTTKERKASYLIDTSPVIVIVPG